MTSDPTTTPDLRDPLSWSDVVTNALRYWEPRRLLYNAVLGAVTLWQLVTHGAFPRPVFVVAAMLFVLAVIANILYSAAYVVDVFVQASVYRDTWRRRRWLLWLLGTVLGAVLAYFVTQGMLVGPD